MPTTLQIASPRLADDALANLVRDIAAAINRETDMTATEPEATPRPGEKGDPITLGTLALAFLSSGAAVGLFQVIKSFFERDETLEVSFERSDGAKLAIKSASAQPERVEATLNQIRAFLREESGDGR